MKQFDPFADRRSRDIRNSLSEAFILAVAQGDPDIVKAAAAKRRQEHPDKVYRRYIEDRLPLYLGVMDKIGRDRLTDPLEQSRAMWNAGLFFELHEHLEAIWLPASGARREALKGLIQAAGTYVHLQRGHLVGARRLAPKAAALLRQHRPHLAFIANLEILLDHLDHLNPVPPRLEGPP